MNLFTIKRGSESCEFRVNQLKILLGNNYEKKYWIKQTLKLFFKKDESEFRKDNSIKAEVLYNGKLLNAKNTLFLVVNDNFSINEDKKLTSSSLMAKYFLELIKDVDYFETINTIDLLLESLGEEIGHESLFKAEFTSLFSKQLLKLMDPFYADELQKDEFDLSHRELIDVQIDLIEEISKRNNVYEHILVLLEDKIIPNHLIEKVESMDPRLIIVVLADECYKCNSEDILVISDKDYDFADSEGMYNEIMNSSNSYYSLEEVDKMIKRYCAEMKPNQRSIIDEILQHFK